MSNSEEYEYLCSILTKLVPAAEITSKELKDLSSALGLSLRDWYYPQKQEEQRRAA